MELMYVTPVQYRQYSPYLDQKSCTRVGLVKQFLSTPMLKLQFSSIRYVSK